MQGVLYPQLPEHDAHQGQVVQAVNYNNLGGW
jgi:hypothetical protein